LGLVSRNGFTDPVRYLKQIAGGDSRHYTEVADTCESRGRNATALRTIRISAELTRFDSRFQIGGYRRRRLRKDAGFRRRRWSKKVSYVSFVHIELRVETA
jgi:hypothetical protein